MSKLSKKERALLHRKKHEEKEALVQKKQHEKDLRKEFRSNIIGGWILAVTGIFALSVIAAFLLSKFFAAKSLAELLPQKKTIAFVEINTNDASGVLKKVQNYEAYKIDTLSSLFEKETGFHFETELKPWLGKKIGIAFFQEGNDVKRAIFLQTRSQRKTLKTLETLRLPQGKDSLVKEPYKNYTLYTFSLSQNFYFTFLDRYVVIADAKPFLQKILDYSSENSSLLAKDSWYIKARNNLPQGKLFWSYVNIEALITTFKTKSNLIEPFLSIFPSFGMSGSSKNSGLTFQTYFNIEKNNLRDQQFFRFDTKYRGKLLQFLEEEGLLSVHGGHDLELQLKRAFEIANEIHPLGNTLFEAMLREQKNTYFGKDISLENDIYPLLRGEYLFAFLEKGSDPSFKLLLEANEQSKESILKLKTQYLKTASFESPQVREIPVEGETPLQEVVSSRKNITEREETYRDTLISHLTIGDFALSYAFLQDIFILTDDAESMKKSIDRVLDNASSNLLNEYHPVLASSDEISVWYANNFASLLLDTQVGAYFEPLRFISSGTTLFEDGISIIFDLPYQLSHPASSVSKTPSQPQSALNP
ncbi:DUF3352 domain-containing protein [Candidatus Peregrinibacteria bacterium]|nr:DUF3352 domain-containing protein [Candidatus Peregrinibacteria bacterium]